MKNILVYVEAAEGKAKNVGLEILTPAKVAADGGKVTAVVIGKGVEEAAKQAITYGADLAVVVDGADYEVYNTDVYTNALVEVIKKYAPNAVFVGATADGKDLAPNAAAKFGSGCVTNVTGVALDDEDQIIGYKFVNFGKMMEFIKGGDDANTAFEKAQGQYGRVDDAVKIIDPRKA